jgi:hypothetical protein
MWDELDDVTFADVELAEVLPNAPLRQFLCGTTCPLWLKIAFEKILRAEKFY